MEYIIAGIAVALFAVFGGFVIWTAVNQDRSERQKVSKVAKISKSERKQMATEKFNSRVNEIVAGVKICNEKIAEYKSNPNMSLDKLKDLLIIIGNNYHDELRTDYIRNDYLYHTEHKLESAEAFYPQEFAVAVEKLNSENIDAKAVIANAENTYAEIEKLIQTKSAELKVEGLPIKEKKSQNEEERSV